MSVKCFIGLTTEEAFSLKYPVFEYPPLGEMNDAFRLKFPKNESFKISLFSDFTFDF